MKPKLSDEDRKIRKLAAQAKYREANREKLRTAAAEWRKANPNYNSTYYRNNSESIKKRTAEYAKENPEKSRAYKTAWSKANPEKVRAMNAAWAKANLEKWKTYNATYRAKNLEKVKNKEREYRLANPSKRTAWQAKRKACQLKATPKWADLNAIKAIYLEASRLGMEVDHIIPLQGETVCGLHVSNNLQLLTKSENSRKRNYYFG